MNQELKQLGYMETQKKAYKSRMRRIGIINQKERKLSLEANLGVNKSVIEYLQDYPQAERRRYV